MLALGLRPPAGGGYELLCIGAHSDDLEIGCAGTLLRLLDEHPVARVTWLVCSGHEARAEEAQRAAALVVGGRAELRLVQGTFRDGFFPHHAAEVKDVFERVKREARPDIVLTHFREDRHQDHRLLSDLTYQTFRDHLILEYEIFKVDGDLGNPNVYVALDREVVERKLRLLQECFGTQRDKRWFDDEVFRGLMRLRGVEAGAPSGYAEAFYARKLVL
jgi:LmbE family N-acetylglucosaminyl deacetylase